MVNKLAYLAGIIDGDGCFSIIIDEGKWYRPHIQLETTSELLASIVYDCLGGYKSECKLSFRKTSFGKKPTIKWSICSKKAQIVAKSMFPYFIVKKLQCEIVKNFYENDVLEREKLYILISSLKNKYIPLKPILRRNDVLCSDAWSYIGGVMDTDGSFSVSTSKRGYKRGTISLTMNCAGSINFITKHCKEGLLCVVNAKNTKQGFQYRFQINKTNHIKLFLDKLLPYLTIKKENALNLYNYCIQALDINGVVKSPLIDLEA